MNENIDKNALNIPIERSIQAELLLLLGQKASHGYELIQRLNDADFKSGEADTATVYRNLRRMDKDGLINSHWEVGESGPGRRLYQLTPQGVESLKIWVQYISQQKAKLEIFLQAYSQYEESLFNEENGVHKP
ncbi:PadR family transcriptional regulator [Desulfosporosinus sp.]|uniref:PadR family transcriptional regulator n=1 Tax=Desulfosporosinus sp. TaxID=157907 RepID=UPI00230D485E|nr:PadR family transcriptional regulator [Desulfosporosinus sp.]MCO5387141.1 PadR family transcriptional regulator [Desulfosporosinus sp.]MDA8222019.1 PadR family transcriptional regulator [Desulfitobacterium hafniense]